MRKLSISKIWSLSVVLYIICSITFCAGNLARINSLSLYFFLGISTLGIINIKHGRLLANGYMYTLIVFGIITAVSLLYSPATSQERSSTLYDYITMAIIVVCIMEYIDSIEKIDLILFAFMISGVTLSLYIYSMYGNNFWAILRANADAQSSNVSRIGGGLTNTNVIGMYTAYGMCIGLFYTLFSKRGNGFRILTAGLSTVCFVLAMATGSKKAVLIMVVMMATMFVFYTWGDNSLSKKIKYLIILIIGLLGLYYLIMNLDIFSGIRMRINSQLTYRLTGIGGVSDVDRSRLISEGLGYWWMSPLWGNGLCSSVHYMGAYAHNNYVEILMNSGIIGFVAFYAIYIPVFRRYICNMKWLRELDKTYTVLFAILCSITVCGFSMVYYYDRYVMILFAVVYRGISIALERSSISEDEKPIYREL